MSAKVLHGDCLDVLPTLPDCSVDAVVTDPPYELGFMGRGWDSTGIAYNVTVWRECLRVLKPGGHLLAFGGTRTWHRMAVAIEDAGFEMRDSIAWIYGSGFPKSLDVSKAIDKAAGAEREVVGRHIQSAQVRTSGYAGESEPMMKWQHDITAPATPDAARWEGWGTALKPAFEPVVVARKPLQGTVAANVLAWGTGALNIDGCRIHTPGSESKSYTVKRMKPGATLAKTGGNWRPEDDTDLPWDVGREYQGQTTAGRWPANVTLDPEAAAEIDRQSGELTSGKAAAGGHVRYAVSGEGIYGGGKGLWQSAGSAGGLYGDTGGASRFFPVFRYEAKAPTSERPKINGIAHPTVKPLKFIRWLVRLVTPPGGTVLDPFAGSGTTGEACILEGFNAILIEREADHLPLIHHRLTRANDALGLFGEETA